MDKEAEIEELNNRFHSESPEGILRFFLYKYKGRIVLSSSLSIEDQVITDMIAKIDKDTRIFTLDTGRLFPETYQLIDKTDSIYNIHIEVFFPNYEEVQRMVREEGINLFYKSTELRHRCCQIRKLEPLKRAFKGVDAWICGLRKEQSITRKDMRKIEWDDIHDRLKINPLIDWSEEQVWNYIKENSVPYNKLYKEGYPSIGCEPCTRPVKEGEDIRNGRWWWENPEQRECGLHKR